MTFRLIPRGGAHYRVTDPDWDDPLDGSFAQASGGRWNAAGSFPVVYLNATVEVARANAIRRFDGQPFGLLELREDRRPVLIETDVPQDEYVDAVTTRGCRAAGLPATYPVDVHGDIVSWDVCQPIGQAAWDADHPGIAARSAAIPNDAGAEELVWFQRSGSELSVSDRRSFEEWFR